MSFKIKGSNTVKWPVTVNVPQDGGTFKTQKFTGYIELIDYDAFQETLESDDSDAALMLAVLKGWENVQDESGAEAEFTQQVAEQLSKIPYFRLGVIRAYRDAVQGGAAKN